MTKADQRAVKLVSSRVYLMVGLKGFSMVAATVKSKAVLTVDLKVVRKAER